ncbi:EpsG family protein [Novosphingobium sp. B 225]|uniref:EpsG family protein n=1 Tax=Novosphingobium sp. B 225 TaxID=1961849 RepID=UPI0011251961|nr:EpsG family protein [Novosphingobium sp. B 225]
MLIYWLMFAFPAVLAVMEPPGGIGRGRPTYAWMLVAIALIVIIGLRWQTGGDWGNYDRMVQSAYWTRNQFGLLGDPGFGMLTRIAAQSQYGMLMVTGVSGVMVSLTLVRFCLAQPRPWLCLAVAVPYFVVVMGMGYIRQGMAVSLLLMAFVGLKNGSVMRYLGWVLAASLFHSTALIMLPFAVLIGTVHPFLRLLLMMAAAAALAFAALSARSGQLVTNYVDQEMTSSGALVRLAMTALPGLALLYWRPRFQLVDAERWIWSIMAGAGVAAFALVLIFPTSTAIDRLGLYLLPLQLFVYARLPDALAGNNRTARVLTVAVVALYAAAFYVWLNYAVNVDYWLPYRFFLFEDGVCLEC